MGGATRDLRRWRRLLIWFGLAVACFQLFRAVHGAETRFITNDGDWYYAYLVSLYFDHDLDLSNQMAAWQHLVGRPRLEIPAGKPTPTAFTVGPAVLWLPAFGLADLGVLAARHAGAPVQRTGYSMPYQLAVALATLCYGLFGVWLALRAALWWCGEESERASQPALAAATALCASPGIYYLVFEPTMAHGLSIFTASLLVWLWLKTGLSGRWGRWAVVGLAGGLCALIRPQDGLLLLLPASILLWSRPGAIPRLRRCCAAAAWVRGSALLAGAAVGFLPQMLVWWATFGQPLAVPQGPEFLLWARPALWQVWFSPHHGLFTWTPVWLLGLAGLSASWRTRDRGAGMKPALPIAVLVVFLLESYLNAAARDWWAGDSYGARRFVGMLPFLTLGLTTLACRLQRRRWGRFVTCPTAGLAIAANLVLMAAYVTGRIA